MLEKVLYRTWQVWKILTGGLSARDWEVIHEFLSGDQVDLFQRMADAEQAHSVRVARDLLAAGYEDRDLLVAALLHDVGKSRYPLSLWERVWIVLKLRYDDRSAHFTDENHDSQPRPLVVSERHPAWGAKMALDAGVSKIAAWLIENHQRENLSTLKNTHRTRLLRALIEADNRN